MPSSVVPERARVLVVEDNMAMAARACAVLAQVCTVVGTVGDGPAALAAADTLRPDVIVLDISMPGMNGFELAARLRATGSTAALVFLTVHEEEEFLDAARAVGAIGYVVKPRLNADLQVAVQEARAGREFPATHH
jgi:CheY-like chemotaxis protein